MNAKRVFFPLLAITLIVVAGYLLHRELAEYSFHEIRYELQQIPGLKLFFALFFTILSYWIVTFFDWLGIKYIKEKLSYSKTLLVSFTSYVMSYNLGLSSMGGTAVRFRLYSSWGFSTLQITQIIAFCSASFWCGFMVTCGLGLMLGRFEIPPHFPLSLFVLRLVGVFLLSIVASYLIQCGRRTTPIKIGSWMFSLPTFRLALAQIGIGFVDLVVAGSVLYLLLPAGGPDFLTFLSIYLFAMFASLVSHVPGGIGVFDTVVLLMLTQWIPAPQVVGALLAYRGIYYLVPLALALIILGANEAVRWRREVVEVQTRVLRILPIVVPPLVATGILVAGVFLLFTGATPSFHGRLLWLGQFFPLAAIEFSHFIGSLIGVALIFLARGLFRRLDATFILSLILMAAGATAALVKGEFGTSVSLFLFLLLLLPCRQYFYRKASIMSQPLSIGWVATFLVVVGISIWLGLFSYKHVEYSSDLWWRFALDADVSRYLRASMGVVILSFILMSARLVASAKPNLTPPGPEVLEQVDTITRNSPSSLANLAYLGDKLFLTSPTGRSYIMYAVQGESWIAMGDPVGDPAEFEALVWRFREICDLHNDSPVFYEVSANLLPIYLDAGFSLSKIGEEAVVPLADFSLEGHSRKRLRTTLIRLEREGCTFEIVSREALPALLPELREISDEWLGSRKNAEKGFSLGNFSEPYLLHFNFGIVKVEGKVVAFTNLLESGNKEEFSIDLMRFSQISPNGCMEYLFIRMILWGKENGYGHFNLGVAPLSGLDNHPLAPLWSRIGANIFERAEHFYHFRGLRAFKDKFDPIWNPKYLATHGGRNLPRILSDLATLISGGWKKMLFS